jgi:hypothetical protein
MAWTAEDYLEGNDGFFAVMDKYGGGAAYAVDAAAEAGDITRINEILDNYRRGTSDATYPGSKDTSTLVNFVKLVTTDPLSAPLDSLNTQISRAMGNVFKNPWVLVTVLAVLFFALGGFDFLKRQLAKR